MTTGAKIGYGSEFAISDDQTTTGIFTAVAGITAITPPGYSRDAIDVSDMDSPDQFREYIAGMMDAGEVGLELNFVAVAADKFIAAMTAGEGGFRITIPGAAPVLWTFLGIVTNYQPSDPFDDKMTASVTIKINGKPTLA